MGTKYILTSKNTRTQGKSIIQFVFFGKTRHVDILKETELYFD